jgi:hypothetical protein
VCFEGQCEAPGDLGDDCQGGEPDCHLGLICLGADNFLQDPGHCERIDTLFTAAVGDPCNFDTGPLCVEGASCVIQTYVVVTGAATFGCVAPSQPGGACRPGLPDACPPGQYCADVNVVAGDIEGTCRALPSAGDPCAMVFGTRCAPGATCNGTTCISPQRLDGACSNDGDCFSGFCDGGLCGSPTCI